MQLTADKVVANFDWQPFLDRARYPMYRHQVVGVQHIVAWNDLSTGRIYGGCVGLFDEMGAGKTKQVIDAAQILFELGVIDRVIVLAPAGVRSVWFDPEIGQLAQHLWDGMPTLVSEYHSKIRQWYSGHRGPTTPDLKWVITNYEYISSPSRLAGLLPFATYKTMLVLDESSAVKNPAAKRTKSALTLRKMCGRVVLLNGTPVPNHPGDLFSQTRLMNQNILGFKYRSQFEARYAVKGGWENKQIIGWRDIDDLQARLAPYVLRRLKVDCLDLPEKLPPVVLTATLTPETWKIYKSMKDDLIAWLSSTVASASPQALTKILRLAQITSGFLGGLENLLDVESADPDAPAPPSSTEPVQEIGREKMDVLLPWLDDRIYEDPNFKLVIWSRFRPEITRLLRELRARYPQAGVGVVAGGYTKADREYALRLLNPSTAPAGPAFIVGNPQSGGLGLNMTAASCMLYMSSDYSLFKRLQADDRVHRPGQIRPVSYFDIVAVGPKGQKTIDHRVREAVMNKEILATLTSKAWVQMLEDE